MSDTVVSLLTAPGTGAIATVEVRGPRAWELARKLFVPAGKPLPDAPEVNRFWFGTLGRDEVVLAATATDAIEVHCHGGQRVVRWVMDQFLASGGRKPPVETNDDTYRECSNRGLTPPARVLELLQRAPTLRTTAILLDQLNGAFALEVQQIIRLLETNPDSAREPLRRLAELGDTVGRHLVEPWRVVVAGPPNVGKSSLVNALAGYQRAVVSEVAGTTRDAVSVRTAFDGWPVELIDTAGLREAEGLEAEGIERAEWELEGADLVLWVMDASASELEFPPSARFMRCDWVMNKSDCSRWSADFPTAAIHVSALKGDGIPSLVSRIVNRLVPNPPSAGAAVPFTPQLVQLSEAARASFYFERFSETANFLREALAAAG